MSVSVNDKNIGHVTAYAYAKAKGYTGTEEEFAQLMADYATVGQAAAQSASEAAQSAQDAAGSSTEATAAKTAAETARTDAQAARDGAQTAEAGAQAARTGAETAQSRAESARTGAETARTQAAGSAEAASTSATNASASETAAAASATAAQTAQTGAETAKTAAETAQGRAESAAGSIAESAEQITANTADINTLKEDKADIDSVYVTDTASGLIASFPDGADGVPVKNLKVNIEPVQAGTGDPSPDNVRPISGHTQAVVTRTGVNIFGGEAFADTIMEKVPNATIDRDAKTVTYAASSVADKVLFENFKPNTRYTMFYTCEGVTNLTIEYTDGSFGYNTASGIYISDAGKSIKCLKGIWSSGTTVMRYDLFGILEGVLTSSDYEPYQGQAVTVDLDGTIYGGTLDVGTGVLTVDRQIVDLGTLTWSYNSETGHKRFQADLPGFKHVGVNDKPNAICDTFATETFTNVYNNASDNIFTLYGNTNRIVVYSSAFSDAASFKTAMNGVQLVYELATPFEVQLTANDIKTLLGTNNIWSDAGNVDVTYRADTRLYIDKRINEAVSALS